MIIIINLYVIIHILLPKSNTNINFLILKFSLKPYRPLKGQQSRFRVLLRQ